MEIMLLEDNPGDVRFIEETLINASHLSDFRLTIAGSLKEGLNRLSKNRFDVILLDLGLSDSQGINTLVEVKRAVPSVPIVVLTGLDDETVGKLAVMNGAHDFWVKDQIDGLMLGKSLSYAVEWQKAEEAYRVSSKELEDRAYKLDLVYDVARQISATLDLQTLLEASVILIQKAYAYPHVAVFLLEDDQLKMRSRAGSYANRFPVDHKLAFGQGLVGWAAKEEEVVCVNHVQHDARYYNPFDEQIIKSELCVPIKANNQFLGILDAQSDQPDAFDDLDVMVLSTLAGQLAVAIQNAHLYTKLQNYAVDLEQSVEEATAVIKQAHEKQEAILANNPDPILLLTPEGVVESANPAVTAVFEYQPEQIIGKPIQHLIAKEYWDATATLIQQAIRDRHPQRCEAVAKRREGAAVSVDMALAPIWSGRIVTGFVCTFRDITVFKEVQLLKDQFVSNVSHELKTPISSMKLYHELMSKVPQAREKYHAQMGRDIDRLDTLIEDLLRLSRLEQGRVDLQLAWTDLHTLVVQFLNDRTLLCQKRGLHLQYQNSVEIPDVYVDGGLLEQAFSVLLTNAMNYTPAEGTITVNISRKQEDEVFWVGICVQDSGPGIEPQEIPLLFERFYRGKVGRKSTASGTGLGLAIAREIVERHHGHIEVKSKGAGQGAAFSIWLPVRQENSLEKIG